MIMYFNSEKADTNIDKEIDKKGNKKNFKKIDFKNIDKKKIFIIGGIVIFLLILLIVIISVTTSKSKINIQVIGGNNIKVYQGSKYFDPGFSAIDKKGNNINDKVVVYNPVDTISDKNYYSNFASSPNGLGDKSKLGRHFAGLFYDNGYQLTKSRKK